MSALELNLLLHLLIFLLHTTCCSSNLEEDDHHVFKYFNESSPNDKTSNSNINLLDTFEEVESSHSSSIIVNVADYGAKGDGADDREAFEKAWMKACSLPASAVILVPENKNYLVTPVTFSGPCKSNVTVNIKGTIEAPSDRSNWDEGNSKHWIVFSGIRNLVVKGSGAINGNGQIWWQNSCKVNKSLPCVVAPTALTFYSCHKLRVENLRIRDSQQIHVSFEQCSSVKAKHLKISAPETSPNTDGIHVAYTRHIHIVNCVIQTGDDCISIVTGSQHIKATGIVCGPGHGISIGSLGQKDSEAYVSDIVVGNSMLRNTTNGVRIKTWQGGHGHAQNIIFEDISMQDVQNPILIDQNYCDSKDPCHEQKSAVRISNVIYRNIKGTSATEVAIKFDCSRGVPCKGVVLQEINLVGQGGNPTRSLCKHVEWTEVEKVHPPPCVKSN